MSKKLYAKLAERSRKAKPTENEGTSQGFVLSSSGYDVVPESRKSAIEEIFDKHEKENLIEPIIANVEFFGRTPRETSLVAITDKLTLKHLQCAHSVKIMLQKDVLKMGVNKIPIYEYSCTTREQLSRCKMYTLRPEDAATIKKVMRTAKKLEEEDDEEV